MTDQKRCPNCNTKLKQGSMFEVYLLSEEATVTINNYRGTSIEAYCAKCGTQYLEEIKKNTDDQKNSIYPDIQENLHHLPVVTIFNPPGWEFESLAMVTGQSTIGTGVITEFTSTFTDLFGVQSHRHNRKIREAEEIVKAQARLQCIELGGNAIVGTDLNYAEIGGYKGMIMVAMTGTAVNIKNLDVLFSQERVSALKDLISKAQKFLGISENT